MIESEKTEGKPIQLNLDPKISTVFIDGIQTVSRDELFILRLFTGLPEGIFEQSRVILTKKTFIDFLDSSCNILNHYPQKPDTE